LYIYLNSVQSDIYNYQISTTIRYLQLSDIYNYQISTTIRYHFYVMSHIDPTKGVNWGYLLSIRVCCLRISSLAIFSTCLASCLSAISETKHKHNLKQENQY